MSGASGGGGSAGSPPVTPPDAGTDPDGGDSGCTEQAARCAVTGREVCGSGLWQPDPCPVNQPTCQGEGQCVVRGPALIAVGNFFIDATEVSVAQYGEFLTAKGNDTSGQSEVCSWNQSYYEGPVVMDPANYPMMNVDWCDAAAYCAWAGKHLCGRIGGGPIARADIFEPNLSQWFVSCGGNGGSSHPNADAVCNANGGFDNFAPVGTFPGCEGFFPGIFDLEGNVYEWIDSCEGNSGPTDVCYAMGGNIFNNQAYCTQVLEDEEDPLLRSNALNGFGFRCCAG